MPWPRRRILPLLLPFLTAACISPSDDGPLDLTGEWCTEASIGADGQALEEEVFMGPRLQHDGNRVSGSGQVKRADSEALWSSRFDGVVSDGRLLMELRPSSAEEEEDAPVAELDLEIRGENDLVGTVTGDAGLAGDISLVRLGQRCTTS